MSAVGVWFFSAAEGLPLCEPHSIWQGHALWHVLTAFSVSFSVLHIMRNFEAAGRRGATAAVPGS